MKEFISRYSRMTNEELNKLHEQYAVKYGKALETALINKTYQLDKTVLIGLKTDSIKGFVFEFLYRNLTELAIIMYITMRKIKDLTSGPNVSYSFCRSLLKITANCQITQFNIDKFNSIINTIDQKYKKTTREYLEFLKNYSLNILGIHFPQTDILLVNKLLNLLEADYYLYSSYSHPYGSRFILCKHDERKIDENVFYVIQKEYIRSHQFPHTLAAEVFQGTSIIREESCEVIFFNKWHQFYSQTRSELNLALQHPNTAICEGLKKLALINYRTANKRELLNFKHIFIQELIEAIYWHERGHHTSYNDEMDPVHFALHFLFIEGDSVLNTVHEALADWSSDGTINRFVELSKSDINRATRNMYVYMSDAWFVDNEDEYMSLMSNVLIGLTVYFINADGTINFLRIEKEKKEIYDLFKIKIKEIMNLLLNVIRNSEYDLGVKILSYSDIENELYEIYQESSNAKPMDELLVFPFYWENVINYLKQFSRSGWDKYQNILKKEAILLEQSVLKLVSKGNEEKYQWSLRNYIIERAIETGIIEVISQELTPDDINTRCV